MLSASWWCLATSCAIVFGNIPNFAQACESSWKLDCVFSVCACFFFFSCVWDPAITKPDLLGSDLLFFTSPTYQPPASVAVNRNGWYLRGELLFPFLAPMFLFQRVTKCECLIVEPKYGNNKFRTSSRHRNCYVLKTVAFFVNSDLFLNMTKCYIFKHICWAYLRN